MDVDGRGISHSAAAAAKQSSSRRGGRFHCTYAGCTANYARREHLRRHTSQQHLSSQQRLFACPVCDRAFPRKDTLRRHAKANHDGGEDVVGRARALRACSNCRSRKAPCRGRSPCDACLERGLQCSLAPLQQHSGTAGEPERVKEPVPRLLQQPRNASAQVDSDLSDTRAYVDAYFSRFHPKWPFLHKATFSPEQETPFLVQSVLMLGLWASQKPCARRLAREIHDKLRVSIQNQKDNWDLSSAVAPSTHWPISTYQGILLNIIFALLRGEDGPSGSASPSSLDLKRTLPAVETDFLLALTRSCRQQRLFHYPTMLQQYSDAGSPIYAWTFTEEVKRFGLALYKVSRLCRLANEPLADEAAPEPSPLLTLADLQFSMPDSDDLWSAKSNAELLARRAKEEEEGKRSSRANDEDAWMANSAPFLRCDAVAFDWI